MIWLKRKSVTFKKKHLEFLESSPMMSSISTITEYYHCGNNVLMFYKEFEIVHEQNYKSQRVTEGHDIIRNWTVTINKKYSKKRTYTGEI